MLVNLNIAVDKELKESAEKILKKYGITMTEAVTYFLQMVVATKSLPLPMNYSKPDKATLYELRNKVTYMKGCNKIKKNEEK